MTMVELRDLFVQYNAHIPDGHRSELGAGFKSCKWVSAAFDSYGDQT
jgi:hypothetical protein